MHVCVVLKCLLCFLCSSGEIEEAGKLYQEALTLAQAAGDAEAIEQLQEGLKELAERKSGQKTEEQEIKE